MVDLESIYKVTTYNNISVLMVEDDNDMALQFKELLEELLFKVDIVVNGEEALEKYINHYNDNKRHHDIVISDINMPNVNGIELVQNIYKINKEQIVVVVSAFTDTQHLISLINIGIEQFFTKPIVYEQFISSIAKVVYKLSKQQELNAADIEENIDLGNGYIWKKHTSTLLYNGNKIRLTYKEKILLELLFQKNRVYSSNEISDHLYGSSEYDNIKNIKYTMVRLRKKIPKDLIENVYGLGYKANI